MSLKSNNYHLNIDWINNVRVNLSAVERRTSSLVKRRSVKKDFQAAWLLKAITLIDLTTLSGDDTLGKVDRLCQKALNPIATIFTFTIYIAHNIVHNYLMHDRALLLLLQCELTLQVLGG